MSVYVDKAQYAYGNMIADTLTELHAMADAIGVAQKHFQLRSFPHYDVCKSKRAAAVAFGAIEVTRAELVGHMKRLRPSLAVEFAAALNANVKREAPTP